MAGDRVNVAQYIGAVALVEEREQGRTGREFLGTAFPINEEHRLYMTAKHVLPAVLDVEGARVGVIIRQQDELHAFFVEETEVLEGQPDVAIIRAEQGCEPFFGLARREVSLLEDVYAMGIPDSLVERKRPGMTLELRALRGIVTRHLEPGRELMIKGPAYEIDAAIPTGMSGAPLFSVSMGRRTDLSGLVGVCLASLDSHTLLWETETEPGVRREAHRVKQYGLAARLFPQYQSEVRLAGTTLENLISYAAGPHQEEPSR